VIHKELAPEGKTVNSEL